MARYKIKDRKTIASLILTSISIPCTIALLIVGGIFFAREHSKVSNYAQSMCQVDSRTFKTYVCKSRANTYSCYGPVWGTHHGENRTVYALVETERRFRYYMDAINKANEYQINSSYSCWYDTRNVSIAQWDKPSARVSIILLCFGGLQILITAILLFITIYRIRREIRQNGQTDVTTGLWTK